MQVILIEPGKEPAMIEVNPDDRVSEVIGGEPVIQALPNLRMVLFTNGEADRQGGAPPRSESARAPPRCR